MKVAEIKTVDWIAVDWGTTHLRVWAMSRDGKVLAHNGSDKGMGSLQPEAFESALLDVVGDWLKEGAVTPVLCCGMVGARQGWVEAPYRETPCAPLQGDMFTSAPTQDPRIDVFIVPGIKQLNPADVMRGEETQLAGFLAQDPNYSGVVCLPGTHSKWTHVRDGKIDRFTTYLTGEIFALLSKSSVLRHSMGKEGWDDAAFEAGLMDAVNHPGSVAQRLFSIRGESILSDLSPAAARARLSGLLIGAELAGAKDYWQGQDVAIVASDALADIYTKALVKLGAKAHACDGQALTLAGLGLAFAQLSAVGFAS